MKLVALQATFALVAGSTLVGDDADRLYFVDGVDRNDGMSAWLSATDRTLRVASDKLDLSDCTTPAVPLCFSSSYMAFAYPAEAPLQWDAAGYEFKRVGVIELKQREGEVTVVRSSQNRKTFHFFLSQTDGLVGWTISYEAPDGEWSELWLDPGFVELAQPQPNNSFKGMPLRGTP